MIKLAWDMIIIWSVIVNNCCYEELESDYCPFCSRVKEIDLRRNP